MAIISKEELISKVNALIADRDDDESISLMEDITDSINAYETKINESGDWKTKYEENDKEWRRRYIERFTTPSDSVKEEVQEEEKEYITEPVSMTSYDDLFEVK